MVISRAPCLASSSFITITFFQHHCHLITSTQLSFHGHQSNECNDTLYGRSPTSCYCVCSSWSLQQSLSWCIHFIMPSSKKSSSKCSNINSCSGIVSAATAIAVATITPTSTSSPSVDKLISAVPPTQFIDPTYYVSAGTLQTLNPINLLPRMMLNLLVT